MKFISTRCGERSRWSRPNRPEQLFHLLFFPSSLSPTIIVIMKKAIHSKSVSCGTHAPIAQQQTPPSPIFMDRCLYIGAIRCLYTAQQYYTHTVKYPPLSLVKVSVRAPLSQFLFCNGRHTKCLCVYTYWWIITCEKNFCEGSCFGFCSSLNLQCWLWQIEYSNELLILQRWEIARNSKEKICLAEMDWSSATFFKNWVFLKRTSHAPSFFFFLFVFLFAQWKQSTDKVE